jgi:hypothetical protein
MDVFILAQALSEEDQSLMAVEFSLPPQDGDGHLELTLSTSDGSPAGGEKDHISCVSAVRTQ